MKNISSPSYFLSTNRNTSNWAFDLVKNTAMIQLKEIKHKEYMRGTKAFRFQMYIFAGMVAFTAAVCIPTYFLFELKRRSPVDKRSEREEADLKKLQEVYKINEMLFEKKN